MKGTILETTKVLIPNKQHESFVHGWEVFEKGKEVEGEPKFIQGKRQGKPFVYCFFYTNDKKLLFLNKVKTETPVKMEKTEVTLGADGPATVVNLRPSEHFTKVKLIGMGIGALAGYVYAKKKGHDLKGSLKFIAGGIVLGYVGAYVIDSNRKGSVKQ